MDVPTELKDWWIYLLPGCFVLVEILFLYGGLVHVLPTFPGPVFNITDVLMYNQTKIALFLLLVVVVGLIIGSLLEGLSYWFFERFQRKIVLSAFRETKSEKEDYIKTLLSDPQLFPADVWRGSFDEVEKHIETVSEFIETQLLRDAKEDESESLNETAVAKTFTQSFFLSFLLFPLVIFWMAVFGFWGIAVPSIAAYPLYLAYLWKDQRDLTQTYWEKT